MNLLSYTAVNSPQPEREFRVTLDPEEARALSVWRAVEENQQCQGQPLRTAKLLLNAQPVEVWNGKRKEVQYKGGTVLEFKRLAIRFQTVSQQESGDQFYQHYTTNRALVKQAWSEITGDTHSIHGQPVADAWLEEGGELKKSGLVDHGTVIAEYHAKVVEKKRWK